MISFPFHVPHIYHSITDPLSFSDLLSCILVNRYWHDTFIPSLWSDVITFRTNPGGSPWQQGTYHDYALHYNGFQGISKHAHHVRALTCQGLQSLQTLFDTFSCVNLVEINFVIDVRSEFPGLDDLVNLMSVNPNLRAISIENVDLNEKTTEAQLHGLLDFIDCTPSITNVCLMPSGLNETQKLWEAVWARMYSRIDRNHIHSLRLHSGHLPRSRRAPTGGRPWPVRETPISVLVPGRILRRALPNIGARWDNEHRARWDNELGPQRQRQCLAILENHGSLELCASEVDIYKLLWSFSGSPPSWDTIHDWSQPPQEFMNSMGTILRQVFPNLRELDFSREFLSSLPMNQISPSLAGLSSLALSFGCQYTPPLPVMLSTLSDALSSLKVQEDIAMVEFFSIVTSCPNLLDLNVSVLHHVPGPEVSPPWICKSLQTLDIKLMYRDWASYQQYDNDLTFEQEAESARQLAPSILQQLGSLSYLKDLSIGLNLEYRVGTSPFFQLSMDPVYGLPQLSEMQRLRTFKVTGLRHRVGQEEIEWMRTHWPWLYSLEVPILTETEDKRTVLLAWRDRFDGCVPDYERWYPGIKVLVPESCYGCAICGYLYCEFDNLRDDDYDYIGGPPAPEEMEQEEEHMGEEYEREERIWALDDEYHLSGHYNVHKSGWWPKHSKRQMQCGHRYPQY